jgi:hypothetical protein
MFYKKYKIELYMAYANTKKYYQNLAIDFV